MGGEPLGLVMLGIQVGGGVGRRVLEMMGEGRSRGGSQMGGGGEGEGGDVCVRCWIVNSALRL